MTNRAMQRTDTKAHLTCVYLKTKYLPTQNYCRDTVRTTKRKHGMAFGLTDKSRRVEWGELRTEKEAFSAVGTLPPHLIIAKAAGQMDDCAYYLL